MGRTSKLVTGKDMYPHRTDLYKKRFFLCRPCWAFVGCHPNGKPMGTLANESLRARRRHAHEVFDWIWRNGHMARGQAYAWLTKQPGIKGIHIGESDHETCKLIIAVCNAFQPKPPEGNGAGAEGEKGEGERK